MTPEMAFECLLVSRDPALSQTMTEVLHQFSIAAKTYSSPSQACREVAEGSHDLVVMDCAEDPFELVQAIWNSPNRRKPTMVAIAGDSRPVAGAHFVLRKPVTSQSATESLKAAYTRMLLDYRLKARYAVMVSVTATSDSGREVSIRVTDIGEGGMGISSKEKLSVGDTLSLALPLCDTPLPVHIQARIIWTRDYGVAGCDFLAIPPIDREILRDWLKAKTRVKKPLISV